MLRRMISMFVLVLVWVSGAQAVTIDTVPVGNPGNAGELSGYGSYTRVCGAVDYMYNIGKYGVSAGQYCEFLNAVAKSDPYGLYSSSMDTDSYGCQITRKGTVGNYTYDFSGGMVEAPGSTALDWENRAVNYVSWGDAARFCNWLHNGQPTGTLTGNPAQDAGLTEDGAYYLNGATTDAALIAINRETDWKWAITTEDEWYKVAYHKNDGVTGNYFDYPTGSDSVPGYVNDSGNLSGTGAPFVEGGTDPGNYATYNGDDGTYGIGSPYYRTEVGEWENSDSPYGTFDQGGNVFEWNETVIDGLRRHARGGSFNGYDYYLHADYRYSYGCYPTDEIDALGFRVAQVPEPTTLLLLFLGALVSMRSGLRRRR